MAGQSQVNEVQTALFQYLTDLNESPTLFPSAEKEKVFMQVLSSQTDNTKTSNRYIHYFSLIYSSKQILAELQNKVEKLSNVMTSTDCPLNEHMTNFRVAFVRNDGITTNIEMIKDTPFYTVTIDLEIVTEPTNE